MRELFRKRVEILGHPYYKFFINIVKCLHISDGCNVRGQLAHALLGGCHQLTKL